MRSRPKRSFVYLGIGVGRNGRVHPSQDSEVGRGRQCETRGGPAYAKATAWQARLRRGYGAACGARRAEDGRWRMRVAPQDGRKQDGSVDAIAEKLDTKLGKWKPEISQEVRALVSQVIDAADNDALDVMRSRAAEQEVIDQLDEPVSEEGGQKTEVRGRWLPRQSFPSATHHGGQASGLGARENAITPGILRVRSSRKDLR